MDILDLMPSLDGLVAYGYSEIKNYGYEDIIEGFLSGLKPEDYPHFVQVSGIPGAGKTTHAKKILQKNFAFIAFDQVMEKIPEYAEDVDKRGIEEAFKAWEMPARVVGYELLRRAIYRKLNVVLEHSGVNQSHIELMKNIKSYGYSTRVDFLICDLESAILRCKKREKKTKRHTPEHLVRERGALVVEYAEKYKTMVNEFRLIKTSK